MERSSLYSLENSNFQNLFKQEKFSDITIVCEKTKVRCHRIVLSASSFYFEDLFTLLEDVNHSVIVLKDINKDQLMKALEFMYVGKIIVHPRDMVEFRMLVEYFKLKINCHFDESLNDSLPEFKSQEMISQEMMSQETTVGNLTIENFQVSSEMENFELTDESSNDSDSTLITKTNSIKLGKDKKLEPLMKKPKVEKILAENKIKCIFCQKYVPEKYSNDHQKHCFKNRNRQSLQCTDCRQDFEVTARLRNHVLKMHPIKPTNFPNNNFSQYF
ncbi:hypothetical protein PVAND_008978 [Polypedilum vanderplanki]|uniref:BTB domain-containing protein n=1 Tax=Polypedilum vanderplanki TaxID=319348 RepID=A0A9J6CCD5_POLVA|nr:hypothetical protein PVAND_008978 [Polypedilum vanderplanki]